MCMIVLLYHLLQKKLPKISKYRVGYTETQYSSKIPPQDAVYLIFTKYFVKRHVEFGTPSKVSLQKQYNNENCIQDLVNKKISKTPTVKAD